MKGKLTEEKIVELAFDENLETGEVILKPYPKLVADTYAQALKDVGEWLGYELDIAPRGMRIATIESCIEALKQGRRGEMPREK